eukprot:COSAG03_NODE_597_length_6804_cov_5.259359_6_plen_221_part_00
MSWSGARQHRPNKQQLSAQRSALEAPQRTRSRTYTQRRRARARPAPAAGAGGESNSRRGPAQISHVLYVNAYVLRYVRRRQNRAQTITQGTGSRRILRVRATACSARVRGGEERALVPSHHREGHTAADYCSTTKPRAERLVSSTSTTHHPRTSCGCWALATSWLFCFWPRATLQSNRWLEAMLREFTLSLSRARVCVCVCVCVCVSLCVCLSPVLQAVL